MLIVDEPRQPVVRRVLLEVDGGRDADRERDERHEDRQHDGPEQALGDAGLAPGRTTAARSGSRCPRVWKTGSARVSMSSRRTARTASENRRLPSSSSWKIDARARPVGSTRGRAGRRPRWRQVRSRLIAASLVPLPRAAHERVADDVEHERHHEQQQRRRRTGSGTPASSPRTWSLPIASEVIARGHRLAGVERVEGERAPPPLAPAASATIIVSPIARLRRQDQRRDDARDRRRERRRACSS